MKQIGLSIELGQLTALLLPPAVVLTPSFPAPIETIVLMPFLAPLLMSILETMSVVLVLGF